MSGLDGRRVKERREALKLTQQELAHEAKVDQGTISRVESGRPIKIYLVTVEKLADALGVRIGDLMFGQKTGEPWPAILEGLNLANPKLKLVLAKIGDLPVVDQEVILNIVIAFLERNERLRRESGQQ